MNRYQREVAEMDRRHRVVVRALSFGGACCLAVLALWSAGLPPTQWVAATQRLWERLSGPSVTTSTTTPNSPTAGAAPAGIATPNSSAQQGTDSSTSTTPLPLYLVATAPGRNRREGTARIGTSLENPQTYNGGAILANGTRLSEIHSDHVVLTRGNHSVDLYLHQGHKNATRSRPASELLMVGAAPVTLPPADRIDAGLNDYLRPNPVYDGEVIRGFEVYPGVRRAVFARLGLQSGDVVTSLNGMPLTDPGQALEMFAQLMQGAAVVATIERKHVASRITLDGALISADHQSVAERAASPPPPVL